MRTILHITSDHHAGYRLGLMIPGTNLFEEGENGTRTPYTPNLTEIQKEIFSVFSRGLEYTAKLAGSDPVVSLCAGDICHGNRFINQLVSTRMADQLIISSANLAMIVESLPTLRSLAIAIGTEVHGFGEGSAEVLVHEVLHRRFPNKKIEILNHGLPRIDGLLVDLAHHGPGSGIRSWLKGNVARFYLRDILLNSKEEDKPDVVLRGHTHTYLHISEIGYHNDREKHHHLIVVPSMTFPNMHAVKVTQSVNSVTIGTIVIEIIDGRIRQIVPLTKTYDLRTRMEL